MTLIRSFLLGLTAATAAVGSPFKPLRTRNVTTYEAEDAELSGTTVDTAVEGYTGTGYITGFDESPDSITFTVSSDSLQLYDLSITYGGIYGEEYTTVMLNDGSGS
ncbi:glycoside hydrolase family 26 protein [Zalerion maritima]|uniref:Glycoside hydrolase family 26 protein n=1 Tax=Zalerion maritima TaxID=339359 RepID=A0AAD5WQA1_9PEZI|nr:glycoside hydrolase family 26 protein [Zalerion maritima]